MNGAGRVGSALQAGNSAELVAQLRQAASLIDKGNDFSTPSGIHYSTQQSQGEVAFLFPGQGSQYLHMGGGLAMTWDAALNPWDVAADVVVEAVTLAVAGTWAVAVTWEVVL